MNRIHPGKEDTFILDFWNEPNEIQRSFQPYYEDCTVDEPADADKLYEVQAKLNDYQIYFLSEVENFCKVFYKSKTMQETRDHAQLNAFLDPAVERFRQKEEETQEIFKKDLISYLRLYSFLAQIMPFQDSDLEKLYAYGRFLLLKLPKRTTERYAFGDEVALKYYRLQKTMEGSIALIAHEGGIVYGADEVATGQEKNEKVELSKIIEILNERFGTDFKPADALFLEQVKEDAIANEELMKVAHANNDINNFGLVFKKVLEGFFVERMDQNQEIFEKFMENNEFQKLVTDYLMKQVYDGIRTKEKSI